MTYQVLITTTFTKVVEVDANTPEQAVELVENDIDTGVIDGCDTDTFSTLVENYQEVKQP